MSRVSWHQYPFTQPPCPSAILAAPLPPSYPVRALHPPQRPTTLSRIGIPIKFFNQLQLAISSPSKSPGYSNKAPHNFPTPAPPRPLSQLFPKLLNANLIVRLPHKPTTSLAPKGYNLNLQCTFHMDASGHAINDC